METRKRTSEPAQIKNEVRTWYAFEGPSGEIVHNKQFFFAWKVMPETRGGTLEDVEQRLAGGAVSRV